MVVKQGILSPPRKFVLGTLGKLPKMFPNIDKSASLPLFNDPEVLSSTYDQAKLFNEIFPERSNLYKFGSSLSIFSSTTNLKLHNISVTSMMIEKVITTFDSSRMPGPDSSPAVFLMDLGPEFSCIFADLFKMCLKESCFQDFFGKSHV